MTKDDNSSFEPVRLVEDTNTGDRFLIYGTARGVQVELRYMGETLWMTQLQMSDLFGVGVPTINEHLGNVFAEGELSEEATIRNFRIVRTEGARQVARNINHYNLDAIISVGYRVSSTQGTMFRKWATTKLVQFAVKGFVVDSERLKDPDGANHFAELREIIRDIRASEANVYKEVRGVCALCSDYGVLSDHEKNVFFAKVQNKLHHAVTNMTGAEIRVGRADASRPNMGLTTWSGGHPTKRDVLTAKNFLGDAEIRDLNRFTGMLLDYFEQETDLQRLVVMADAEQKLDTFIRNNERPLLRGRGSVSKKSADEHTKRQYDIYNEQRRLQRHAEADRAVSELIKQEKTLPKKSK